ncbi:hypothetical protein [Prochlorococcus sp. MIT 1300]|uniref:hypothetical protein n=1 Tax=Prochlorococcus sp. MIT 1300 TaxID=3096218 RepID=UPI002A74B8CE|nr:hypothetical protein [Prochlorococcus sp. MIT 1300]
MAIRPLHWVNTPVLMEAILRYQEGRLAKPMRLWVEQLLELKPSKNQICALTNDSHIEEIQ